MALRVYYFIHQIPIKSKRKKKTYFVRTYSGRRCNGAWVKTSAHLYRCLECNLTRSYKLVAKYGKRDELLELVLSAKHKEETK